MNPVILITIVYLLINYTNNQYVNKKGQQFYQNNDPDIYDISYEYLPNYEKHEYLSHMYVFLCLLPFLVFWNTNAVMSFLSFLIPIFVLRDITINLTILPKRKKCSVNNTNMINGCYDKIFSGHVVIVLLATIMFYEFGIIRNVKLLIMMNMINILLILSTRHHYTIDVFLGIVLTILMYSNNIHLS